MEYPVILIATVHEVTPNGSSTTIEESGIIYNDSEANEFRRKYPNSEITVRQVFQGVTPSNNISARNVAEQKPKMDVGAKITIYIFLANLIFWAGYWIGDYKNDVKNFEYRQEIKTLKDSILKITTIQISKQISTNDTTNNNYNKKDSHNLNIK